MSKLFSAAQIKNWDASTVLHEPIASIDLMERAALCCCKWITEHYNLGQHFTILCGQGNNGGDGLAIARILLQANYKVNVIITSKEKRSKDNLINLERLQTLYSESISQFDKEISLPANSVLIDAILGTGLQRAAEGVELEMIRWINVKQHEVISIDLPSGLSADEYFQKAEIVQANFTLSFQQYKKTFLFIESGTYCGEIKILDIGLDKQFYQQEISSNYILDAEEILSKYTKRKPFTHKGTYGHALLITGSKGMMGASILSAKACIRSGCGLLSLLIPENERSILQCAVPEAICIFRKPNPTNFELEKYDATGIGCGLGNHNESYHLLSQILLESKKSMVLDADAINIISSHPELLNHIHKYSVLTPHPKEFDRLFGLSVNSFERHEKQKAKSIELGLYIILKGRYTSITTPAGISYFNINGNPGMATAGSGDVLTGIITSLLHNIMIWKLLFYSRFLYMV
ncbi:MAG: NAD(P)H-hydrate dehydratase [Bacteroidetes bacterium]|nr:NAD(P)H-hydrate dehydratase [Bacteroidota bacterium]